MWSKITHVLKPRPDSYGTSGPPGEVVHHEQSNVTVFHTATDITIPNPSPPSSPSKHGRRNMLKRLSRAKGDDADSVVPASPKKAPIGLPKKVKSSLHLNTNFSTTSLIRPSTETTRPSVDFNSVRTSHEAYPRPETPVDKQGSVRSILRDPKTPGTGQNVRFFSRDAYKVISPDISASSEVPDPMSFANRLASSSNKSSRPTAASVFAHGPPGDLPAQPEFSREAQTPPASLSSPGASQDPSNFFDMSQGELPPIPHDYPPLLDSAIEMSEGHSGFLAASGAALSAEPMTSTPPRTREPGASAGGAVAASHSRSHSFSFGQTVAQTIDRATGQPALTGESARQDAGNASQTSVRSRGRALSDTVFQSMLRTSSTSHSSSSSSGAPPEMDINDESSQDLVVYKTSEPDPFRVDANTYYTPQTMIPPSPAKHEVQHARKPSKEEDLIWSLRTQLAVQQEICGQFEVDLGARDQLVQMLHTKLESTEREGRERRVAARAWRKKVQELERACRNLEEEVEHSRQDSVERSVMDEASGEALRELHRRIAGLEREKGELARRAAEAKNESNTLQEELRASKESEKQLRGGIESVQTEMEKLAHTSIVAGDGDEELKRTLVDRERENEEERQRHMHAEFAWEEEKAEFFTKMSALQVQRDDEAAKCLRLQEQLDSLRAELEAQWKNAESGAQRLEELELENQRLERELDTLKAEAHEHAEQYKAAERAWHEADKKIDDLEVEVQQRWELQVQAETVREQLEAELVGEQEYGSDLKQALQERDDIVATMDQERAFANDNVARLEAHVSQLKDELSVVSQRAARLDAEAEDLREEVSSLKREHTHSSSAHIRALEEATAREAEARSQLEALVREKAQRDVSLASLNDRAGEVDKLRRLVHELQQESADKEVKIVQLNKSRAQDKDDLNGLNIALDSKQQELELLKRRLGLRGTAGSTPAQSKIAHHRRDSSVFSSTPGGVRPPSAMSDVSARESSRERKVETPVTATRTLGKSVRVNAGASKPAGTGSMGPPPTKPRASVQTPGHSKTSSSSLSRSGSASSNVTPLRRPSSVTVKGRQSVPASSALSEMDEKENSVTPAARAAQRNSSIPVPA